MAKVEALPYDDRTVYSVAAFNRGVAQWLTRLPTVWVEGEVTELRRHERWATVYFTLKDPADGSCVGVTMARGRFDALRLDLADGERVHVFARPELYEQRGEFKLRALTIERFGAGAHLASLERLKASLAAAGLFAEDVRASTPTAAGKLVVPELTELYGTLDRAHGALARSVLRLLEHDRQRLARSVERLRSGPRLAVQRESLRLARARERLRLAPSLAVERKRAAL